MHVPFRFCERARNVGNAMLANADDKRVYCTLCNRVSSLSVHQRLGTFFFVTLLQ